MSLDEIAHLDFTPDYGAGLHEAALRAFQYDKQLREHKRQEKVHALLTLAQECLSEKLDVINAANVQVTVKNDDGDGEVTCEVDRMEFRVSAIYPSSHDGDAEPSQVNLWVRTGNNWSPVRDLVDLGKYLDKGSIHSWSRTSHALPSDPGQAYMDRGGNRAGGPL